MIFLEFRHNSVAALGQDVQGKAVPLTRASGRNTRVVTGLELVSFSVTGNVSLNFSSSVEYFGFRYVMGFGGQGRVRMGLQ